VTAQTQLLAVSSQAAATINALSQRYGSVVALDNINLDLQMGALTGFIGPDAVGKSTLLSIIAGARRIQSGSVCVLGADLRDSGRRRQVSPRIAYMPQGLGRNLYSELTVVENIEFFGRLFGEDRQQLRAEIRELLVSTGLEQFGDRAAKNLSGGMRQKLGLCCALIHEPDLLLLDEPTTGVDPLSRRQFWDLIARMRARQPGMTVLVATAYMEEAEHFDRLVMMNAGRILATGSPRDILRDCAAASLEDAFVSLLPKEFGFAHRRVKVPPLLNATDEPAIVARHLTRRFGDFVAVDDVSFTIQRGEIFGFVGSNGSGKTTTMKMITGLLPATEGEAWVLGEPVQARSMKSRGQIGYMSQSFSLYTELTVEQNLSLHAKLFGIGPGEAAKRVRFLSEKFGLAPYMHDEAIQLPLGIRQRLSLAVAVVHSPQILILDEPTSGVDPVARDQFWELLIDLSRNQAVTIFVSTHFMNEAARCDRIALMDSGKVLALAKPQELVKARRAATLEDAFISYLREQRREEATDLVHVDKIKSLPRTTKSVSAISPRRLVAFAIKESLELLRDPVRLTFALAGAALLMLIFGFGISTDVDNLTFAVLDRDHSPESRAFIQEFAGSRYFTEKAPITSYKDLDRRLQTSAIRAAIEIPPGFGRDIKRGRPVSVSAWIDGAMPFRAETIRGYIEGTSNQYLTEFAYQNQVPSLPPNASVDIRFLYNQDFESVFAMVPGTLALLLALIPAILMAVAVVREKELGSISNLYATPASRLEFLVGKQIPYVTVAMASFFLMCVMGVFIFNVPIRGSFALLTGAAFIYVFVTTAYGMVISTFTRSQIAALFGTAILTMLPASQFAGLLTPVSSLTGTAAFLGRAFPMSYFLPISVGVFTKGLGVADLGLYLAELSIFVPVLLGVSMFLLKKQEI